MRQLLDFKSFLVVGIIALLPMVARANTQYDQPYRAVVNGVDRLYIPDNPPRSAIAISLLVESTSTYLVNSGWIKIDNSRLEVFEVGGIIPQRGSIPSGAGSPGDAIDAGAIGVYFWAGTESPFQELQVIRRRLIVSMTNACGVATFPRPLANFDFRGTVFDFNQLSIVPLPSYCKSN
ncbi:hypothetical protein [Microcoleus sp. SVA1_A1]|uniref:hypothetical protein n=1 Tax=Microcoleus sp. SVA1_A1 TaxID=2818946 RepID=UPI002FCFB6E8